MPHGQEASRCCHLLALLVALALLLHAFFLLAFQPSNQQIQAAHSFGNSTSFVEGRNGSLCADLRVDVSMAVGLSGQQHSFPPSFDLEAQLCLNDNHAKGIVYVGCTFQQLPPGLSEIPLAAAIVHAYVVGHVDVFAFGSFHNDVFAACAFLAASIGMWCTATVHALVSAYCICPRVLPAIEGINFFDSRVGVRFAQSRVARRTLTKKRIARFCGFAWFIEMSVVPFSAGDIDSFLWDCFAFMRGEYSHITFLGRAQKFAFNLPTMPVFAICLATLPFVAKLVRPTAAHFDSVNGVVSMAFVWRYMVLGYVRGRESLQVLEPSLLAGRLVLGIACGNARLTAILQVFVTAADIFTLLLSHDPQPYSIKVYLATQVGLCASLVSLCCVAEWFQFCETDAELRVSRSNNSYHLAQRMLSGMCDAVTMLDEDLVIAERCPKLAALLLQHGGALALQGRSLIDFVNESDVERLRAQADIALRSLTEGNADSIFPSAFHVHLKSSVKTLVPVVLTWCCSTDSEGDIWHMVAIQEELSAEDRASATADDVAPLLGELAQPSPQTPLPTRPPQMPQPTVSSVPTETARLGSVPTEPQEAAASTSSWPLGPASKGRRTPPRSRGHRATSAQRA
mmetsp:Transcript_28987/g.93066  ORF Transcript_28987/g.93066 Transcript_28987/m.93066 type:complete len:625 (-) Transcript_28987:582-2456(-)